MKSPPSFAALPAPPAGRTDWPWAAPAAPPAHVASRPHWPRITLITPSFNQGTFIEETIRSVLLQQYPNLEYIVIDGGSTDDTKAVLAKYDTFIDHWVSEPDRGQSDAINKGLAIATGEWVNWLNSDDYLAPGALFALVRQAEAGACTIVSGITANLRGSSVFSRYSTRLGPGASALFNLGVNQPGSLLSRAAVQAVGGIRPELHLVMDLDLWVRLLLRDGFDHLGQSGQEVAVYRYHESSKTCSATDVFAGEEFVVLHDLFRCLAAQDALAPLNRVRALSSLAPLAYAGTLAETPDAIARAYLERLVVQDSLLFRTLRCLLKDDEAALHRFAELMAELQPQLHHFFGPAAGRIEGLASLHALEETGHLSSWALAWRALRQSPAPSTLRALTRLWVRPDAKT